MNKEAVLHLLQNIYAHKLIGVASIDALTFAIEKGLVERTEIGNLILSDRGLAFLNGSVKWEDLNQV